jgi:PAS domain S-box-containing protein
VQGAQWLQWQKRPIYLPEHQQYGVLGVGVNITNRKLAEDALKSLVEGTAAVTGTDFFSALVKYIASALNVSHVIVTQKVGEDMQTLAFWSNGALQPNISYRLAQTPCEITLRQGQYCCLSNTPLAFPDAPALASLQIESYQGLALQNSSGDTIGSLCILDRQALPDPDKTAAILQVFAARASAELERLWATNALEQLTQELEIKVEERTAALRHSEERWQLALEAANYSIWDWDFRTNRVFRSKRWRDLRGFDDDDVSDRPEEWANTIHPDDYEQVMTAFADHFAGRSEFFELEYRVRRKDGSYIWILDRGKALQEENGQILRMLGSETDITQRKLAEADLKKTNEQLAIANVELARATRLKDEFLANMSHELRTPLNAILGLSEALQDDAFGTLNESQKRAMTTIEQSGRHLLELITDILDLSKIEAGKLELEVAAVSVHHLCESSLSFVRHQAMQKSIPITVNIQPDLERILVDERRMRQVLINLLNNAVKFTPAGGHVALDVTLESSAEQTSSLSTDAPTSAHDYLVFSILDTGIGIAPDDLGKLFQAFVQIDSSLNRQYSGTGLGLALVRRIVDLHNGTVTVSSTVGEGSCFTVRLPYVGVSAPLSPSSTVSQREEQARSLHSPPTELTSNSTVKSPLILLVDDHPANVEVISTYLKSCGYSIAIAHSGQSAIDTATAQPPDLIVMDIQMPGMDGLEAIRRIRVLPQLTHIPIIAFTALAMPRDREACLAAGANDYLAKPVLLKQLTAVIQRLLDNRSQSSR